VHTGTVGVMNADSIIKGRTPQSVDSPAAPEPVLLESGRRFSECLLWERQRNFFQRRGIDAWRGGVVPQYITSHPFLAEAYARVTLDWLREVRRSPEFNPDLPVRIFELAAGSGRFGLYFLRSFSRVLETERKCEKDFFERPGSLRYVMTDLVAANVEFWRNHESFAPFVDAGLLEFQCLDLDWSADERPMQSPASSFRADPATPGNPVGVIANYCFDSLRNDVFLLRGGRLFEGRVDVLSSARNAEPATDASSDAEDFARLELRYDYHPVENAAGYYREAEFNRLLAEYQSTLADTIFVFPVGALSVLRKFAALAGGRMLLLSADKGFAREEDLLRGSEPDLVLHGCFSLMVNYHAIRRFFALRGGSFRQSAAADAGLKLVSASCGFENARVAARVEAAAREYLERLNPEDLYILRKNLAAFDDRPPAPVAGEARGGAFAGLNGLFARLRFGGCDSEIFFALYHRLRAELPAADPVQKRELLRIAREIHANHYDLGEGRDLAFHLGVLLHEVGFHRESLWFFERSYESEAPDTNTVYNLAVCHYELRDFAQARRFVAESLALDPDQPAARALRIKLESESAGA
jgi:hypothetical protein